MRIAYVASHIPRRHELASGPIDAEWIVDESGPLDLAVFVDYESDGTDLLAAAGVTVSVSPKRPVLFAEGSYETAEQQQARLLLEMHLGQPFDAIVYDSTQTSDWAWYQARLGSVPRGIALGPGAVRDMRIVAASPTLVASHGRTMWALTGALASADFLVSDIEAADYGLGEAGLPDRYSINDLPALPAPTGTAGMIAVVALSEDPAGLTSLLQRTRARVAGDDGTIIALIHPDIATGPETTRDILLSSVGTDLAQRVRFAEPSSDGVAAGLLAQADVIVAARPSDLAVRAVADAAAKVGGVVLSDIGRSAPHLAEARLEKVSHRAPRLVPVDGPLEDLIPTLDTATADSPALVLHTPRAAGTAARIWKLPGSSRAGLMLVCDTGPYLGEADPARPALSVLGFSSDCWPSVRRLLETFNTLHEVVEAAASLAHADRVNLLALPERGAAQGTLGSAIAPGPAWVTDTGNLPPLASWGSGEAETAADAYRHPAAEASIKHWAETHGFRDRIRLALPWKWGLLNRAMRNRW